MFDSGCQVLTNPINTIGAMGAGLALIFRNRYPDMYMDYRHRCLLKKVKIGEPYLIKCHGQEILMFPTKDDWRQPSKIEWIAAGLNYFLSHYHDWGIESIAFPLLGAGRGTLPRDKVLELMKSTFEGLDIDVWIYA